MRWSIRYQLLVPPLTLLLGVVGISTWTALASANRARQQIETQVRDIGRAVNQVSFPHERSILKLMRGLSGAEYQIDDPLLGVIPSFETPARATDLPKPADDWSNLELGDPVAVQGKVYRCNGLVIRRPSGATFTL